MQCLLGGLTYWVANGLFYHLTSAGNYVSSTEPPLGLVVPTLVNAIPITWNGSLAYLKNHTIYRPVWINGMQEYKVIAYT